MRTLLLAGGILLASCGTEVVRERTVFDKCKQGKAGKDGVNGADGVNGQDGADGQDGLNASPCVVEFDFLKKKRRYYYYNVYMSCGEQRVLLLEKSRYRTPKH